MFKWISRSLNQWTDLISERQCDRRFVNLTITLTTALKTKNIPWINSFLLFFRCTNKSWTNIPLYFSILSFSFLQKMSCFIMHLFNSMSYWFLSPSPFLFFADYIKSNRKLTKCTARDSVKGFYACSENIARIANAVQVTIWL